MRKINFILSMLLILSSVSCASAGSRSRMAFITAKDHGWIEVSVTDSGIPPVPPRENETEYTPRPPYCSITIKLNNEEFVSEPVFPFGDQHPYRLETGFRFPAPVGVFRLSVHYFGCKLYEAEENKIIVEAEIEVIKDFVTPVKFNGDSLTVDPLYMDEKITLKDIDDRLKIIEEILETK